MKPRSIMHAFLFLGWIGLVALTIVEGMLSYYGLGRYENQTDSPRRRRLR